MEINGQLNLDIQEDMINDYININNTYSQLDDFLIELFCMKNIMKK